MPRDLLAAENASPAGTAHHLVRDILAGSDELPKPEGPRDLLGQEFGGNLGPREQSELHPQAQDWQPSLWDRISSLIAPNNARAMNEYAAREIAVEDGTSPDEAYEAAGGHRPLFNPEGRPLIEAITDATGIVAKQIPYVPEAAANTVLRMIRNGDESVDQSLLDRAIDATELPEQPFRDPNYAAFNDIGQSLGYSLSTLTASALAFAGGTAATGNPVVGAGASMIASGAVAYRGSKDQFLDRLKQSIGDQHVAVHGVPLPQEVWDEAIEEYEGAATRYGAWEAIPEAASNLIFMRALAAPLKAVTSKKLLEIGTRAAQVMASEQVTETATAFGQSHAEAEANLGRPLTVGQAFRQQAIQTAVVTGLIGAGGAGGKKAFDTLARPKETPDPTQPAFSEEDAAATVEAVFEAQTIDEVLSASEKISSEITAAIPGAEEANLEFSEGAEETELTAAEMLASADIDFTPISDELLRQREAEFQAEDDVLLQKAEELGDFDNAVAENQLVASMQYKTPANQAMAEAMVAALGEDSQTGANREAVEQEGIQEATDKSTQNNQPPISDSPQSQAGPTTEEIGLAASEAATSPDNALVEPSAAMKSAGNYKMGHTQVAGLDISIENPKGSQRSGTDPDGNKWSVEMQHHYGYVKRTTGADSENVDVFIGANPDAPNVYIVDQVNKDGSFDEHKIMLGFDNQNAAIEGYAANYDANWTVGPVTEVSTGEFKTWLEEGDTKRPYSRAKFADPAPESKLDQEAATAEIVPAAPVAAVPETETQEPSRVEERLPPIIADSKRAHLRKMAKANGLKKSSPGYDSAIQGLEEQYEDDLDRAYASISFEKFQELHSDIPESINRQAHDQLREEFAAEEGAESLPEASAGEVAETSGPGRSIGEKTGGYKTGVGKGEAIEVKSDDGSEYSPDGVRSGSSEGRRPGDYRGRSPVLGKYVALGISDEIRETGSAYLVGRKIDSAKGLAELAQVYRDPRYETLRYFFTKNNEIVHATGVTVRMPARAPLVPRGHEGDTAQWIRDQMEDAGADGYWLLHNHPSGNPTPSTEDIDTTKSIASQVEGFQGHVVINSNEFAYIDQEGSTYNEEADFGEDKLLTPSKPSAHLKKQISGPLSLATVGKSFQQDGYITVIGASGREGVRFVSEIDVPLFSDIEKAKNTVKTMAANTGSGSIYIYGGHSDIASAHKISDLIADGYVIDIVTDQGVSYRDTVDAPAYPNFGDGGGVGGDIVATEGQLYEPEDVAAGALFDADVSGKGGTVKQVRSWIARIALRWDGPKIKVVQSIDELPDRAQELAKKQKLKSVSGYADSETDTIYLVADAIGTKEFVQRKLRHEATHLALSDMLGLEEYQKIRDKIEFLEVEDDVVKAAATYVDGNYKNLADDRRADEIIARLAEDAPNHNLITRIYLKVRAWLRKRGFDKLEFTRGDLQELLRRTDRHLASGEYGQRMQPIGAGGRLSGDRGSNTGNIIKGHMRLHGMDISIEHPRGSTRSGVDPDGREWSRTMSIDYGHLRSKQGTDGEHLGVFIGDKQDSNFAYVVDQLKHNGQFDESKVLLGFESQSEAVEAYKSNFDVDWQMGPVTAMSISGLKKWLKSGDLTQPRAKPEKIKEFSQPIAAQGATTSTMPSADYQAGEDVQSDSPAQGPHQLIQSLRKHFNVPVRQGRISSPRAAGTHDKQSGVIRLRNMVDVEVFSHELGHALESRYGQKLTEIIGANRGEVAPLSYSQRFNESQLLREGFAEFFRSYVLNPNYVKKQAPEFYSAFEDYLVQNHLNDYTKIAEIRDLYQQYLRSPSGARVGASISTGDKGSIYQRFVHAVNPKNIREHLRVWGYQTYTDYINRQHPIYVAEELLKEIHEDKSVSRIDLKRAEQSHVLARLALDAYSAAQVSLEKGVIPYEDIYPQGASLREAITTALDNSFSVQGIRDFGAYLVSRRAVHEWDRFKKGELPMRPTQETQIDHIRAIAHFQSEHPSFEKAAEQVYEFTNNLWLKKRDAGLITPAQYEGGLEVHKDYVPFMRDRSDLTELLPRKPKASGKSGALQRFTGSERPIINPLESIMTDAYQTEALIKGNDARKALADLAKKVGYGGGAVIEKIPDQEVKASAISIEEVKKALMSQVDWTGLSERDSATLQAMLGGLDAIDAPMLRLYRTGDINERGEPIIYVWRDGNREAYRLADGEFGMDLYNAITGINREQVGQLVNLLSVPAATLRLGVTTEPTFQVVNMIRGELTAWALNPDYRPVVDFSSGGYSAAVYDEAKQAYVGAGGIMGGINTNSLAAERALKDIAELSRQGLDIRRVTFREALKLSEFSESAMRIGLAKRTFKKAKDRGLSNKEAIIEGAFVARDITDYGRHGSKMAGAQRLVTFLNASLQGMDKFLRVLGGAGAYQKALSLVFDKTSSKKLTSLERDNLAAARSLYTKMMVLGLIGVGLTSLYRDDPEYQEISDYLRASHWLVKVPGGKWLVIPKPFQEAVLSNIFERVYEMYYYNDPAAMDRLLNGIALSMGPPMVPVFARPIIEHFGNKSIYNGMPLISQRLNGLEPEQQFYSWTSSFAKKAGEALGVSPILIDHYITSYTGTLGRTVLGFTSASDPQAPDQGPDDMFFVRRFIRDYTRSSVSNKAFYEKMARDGGELNAKYLTFRNFVRNDSDDEARDYLRKMSGEESVYVMARFTGYLKPSASQRKFHPLERAQDVAGSIYSLRREVRASTTLSPRVKQRVDDALSERVVMEFRNAMIATGVRGYKGRGMMDLGKNDRKIKIGSKAVYEELQALVSKYPDAESTYNDYEAFSEAMLGQRDDVLESNGDIDQRAANDFDG